MANGKRESHEHEEPKPSVAQMVHSATGDRDAEARTLLRKSSDEATLEDARLAVDRAYGETPDAPAPEEHLASVDEVEQAHKEREEDPERG